MDEHLRVTASKYRESADSEENSDFLLLRQKDPFGELFSEIYFQSSSEFTTTTCCRGELHGVTL